MKVATVRSLIREESIEDAVETPLLCIASYEISGEVPSWVSMRVTNMIDRLVPFEATPGNC